MAKAGDTFFRPLGRRVAIVLVCAGWAFVEWAYGNETWAMVAAAVTAYGAWSLLYAYKIPPDEDGKDG